MQEKWTLEGGLLKCLEKIEENRHLSVDYNESLGRKMKSISPSPYPGRLS